MRLLTIILVGLLVCDASWAQTKRPASVPVVQTIGVGIVWRESADERPPWKQITIANIFGFKKRPVVGQKVTVVTVGSGIPAFDLRIIKAQNRKNPCSERLPPEWEVELEPIKQKIFFDVSSPSDRRAEFPFDVVILYPAVKTAQQIRKPQLKLETLPRGVVVDTVKAAIDLNVDRKPDVVEMEYCCEQETKPAKECNYTCSKTFKKVKNVWKLVDTSAPC